MAVRITQGQNKTVRSTQGGGGRHPNKLCSKAKLQIKDLHFKYSVNN